MKFAFTLVSVVVLLSASAQKRKTFKVSPGQKVIDAIPWNEMYTYSDFPDGTVYLRGDKFSNAKLNYNSLFSDIVFIDSNGDTLSLADEGTIRYIAIKHDTFYFDKVYVRLVQNYGDVKLANRQYFAFTNRQKIGGFGETSEASIDTYDKINLGAIKELVAKELLTLSKYSVYYIGDRFNHFKPANKKNLLDMYGNKQEKVQQYLKENKVDFTNEDDLKKILAFLEKN